MPAPFWTLDNLPVGVWVGAVPGGTVVYSNKAFRTIVGMEPVGGSRIDDVPVTYHVRDRQGHAYPVEQLPYARALTELGPVLVDDMVLHRSDGVQVYLRAFGIPRFDDTGTPTEVVVVFLDITREVMVEAERDMINKRLDLVVNHAPVAIWAADLEGNVTLSEGAGLAVLGVRAGELVGKNVFVLYQNHPTIPGFLRRGLAGEPLFYTVTVGPATYDTWLLPLRDDSGTQTGIAGMSLDVSEIRQLQTHAIQHDHQAAMGLLAASVAHEINNPISYVLGSTTALEREVERLAALPGAADPEVQAAVQRLRAELAPIRDGASRIATITRDLRTFSRFDDDRAPIQVCDVLRSAIQLTRKEIEANASLVLDLAADATVLANHARLLQVFLNLLTNALQALPASGHGEIRVATRRAGDRIEIDVADTGRGVPEALRERIFEPFVTTKGVGEGTGLGLFVCRNIVRALGGTIELHPPAAGGALFRTSLPIHDGTSAVAADRPVTTTTGARILVVDDDSLVLRAVVAQLTFHEYVVTACEDGARALAILEHEAFDLVFCDLMMRGMTGMALDAALRARGSANADRLVFMTGGAFTAEGQIFVRANAARVVDKPFDIVAETERRLAASR